MRNAKFKMKNYNQTDPTDRTYYFALFLALLFFSSCAGLADLLGGDIKSSRSQGKESPSKREPAPIFAEEESKSAEEAPEKKISSPAERKVRFSWPADGPVTSLFGSRHGRPHEGIDISVKKGTPVRASRQGMVIHSGRLSGYGNLVIVKHESNYYSAYGHLLAIKTSKGKRLKQGQVLGLSGRTGRSSGSHVHFEIRHETKALDPLSFLSHNRFGVRQREGGED